MVRSWVLALAVAGVLGAASVAEARVIISPRPPGGVGVGGAGVSDHV